jgi:hypothetical protein
MSVGFRRRVDGDRLEPRPKHRDGAAVWDLRSHRLVAPPGVVIEPIQIVRHASVRDVSVVPVLSDRLVDFLGGPRSPDIGRPAARFAADMA